MAELECLRERYDSAVPVGDGATLFWTLSAHPDDGDGSRIRLAIAYLLPNPPCDRRHRVDGGSGGKEVDDDDVCVDYWLGFGMSPQGGMVGADIALYLPRNDDSEGRLIDAHGVGYSVPIVDECGQDWTLANYTTAAASDEGERDGHAWRVLEVERSLQSNDVNEDLPFIDDSSSMIDPTRVLVAWGLAKNANVRANAESEGAANDGSLDLASTIEPHGPSGRASTSVRFFRTPSPSQPQTDRDGMDGGGLDRYPYIDLLPVEPYEIPGEETTYKNFCFSIEDYPELANILTGEDGLEKGVHIVGFEDVVDDGSSVQVHHMDLHGTTNEILGADKRLCRLYLDLVHPWEAGSPTRFELPQEAGTPLGGPDGYQAFRVEIHYNNPLQKSGQVDRSGVRLYYSLEHRPNVAGLMLLGDYMLKLRGSYTVGGSGKGLASDVGGMRHSFYCPSACFSNERLGGNNNAGGVAGVTIFREVLHMHKSGERMTNVQINSNGSVARASEANHFDFTQGAGYASRSDIPYRIRAGDSFVTTCFYSKAGVLWGSSSDEEMCQAFLWVYPKKGALSCGYLDSGGAATDSRCEMGYDRAEIRPDTDLERLGPGETCEESNHQSQRSPGRYGPIYTEKLQSWPSLLRLVNQWKTIMRPSPSESNNTALSTSLLPKEGCHLCPGGQMPGQPDTMIPGFSWTCDELDAAIPVLYSRPELLFFSPGDVAPCGDYRASFGELCGCPSTENAGSISSRPMEAEEVHRNDVLPFGAVIVVLAILATTFVLKSRQRIGTFTSFTSWRAVPTTEPPSEQTSSCA